MLKNQKGQGLAEYALIIALIAVVIAGTLTAFQGQLTNVFTAIGNAFNIGGG